VVQSCKVVNARCPWKSKLDTASVEEGRTGSKFVVVRLPQ